MGGSAPIHEAGLEELLRRHVGRSFRATTELADAVTGSELTLIAVGTPLGDDGIDLTALRAATRQVGEALRDKAGYHVVVGQEHRRPRDDGGASSSRCSRRPRASAPETTSAWARTRSS